MYNPFSLQGKTILVTGASSGIGKSIAIECSKMGASVIITGRNEERLSETFSLLNGHSHQQIISDLSDNNSFIHLMDSLPKLDGVVNNAGLTKTALLQFLNKEDLLDVLEINTIKPILLTQTLIKKKIINKGGSIVFTSSISGVHCSAPASSIYSTSKGAINGFIKGAAIDLASKNIRVNSVNPGMIETEIFSEGIITSEQLEIDKQRYPLKRYGKPEEVAYAVVYLLSDASKWVTGSNLLIDGGYTLL